MTLQLLWHDDWLTLCDRADLTPGRGVAALLPDGRQAALFLDRAARPYAIGNRDPFSGAQVLSRGLIGTHGGRTFVASPLLKQRFDLETGVCLDDATVSVPAFTVRTAEQDTAAKAARRGPSRRETVARPPGGGPGRTLEP